MKFLKSMVLLLTLSVCMISCGDDEGSPEISITSPEDGAIYSAGDVVNFVISLTDDIGVVSVNVESTDFNVNETVTIDSPTAAATFNFDLTLDATTQAGDYEITFTANDADANSDDEKIKITIE